MLWGIMYFCWKFYPVSCASIRFRGFRFASPVMVLPLLTWLASLILIPKVLREIIQVKYIIPQIIHGPTAMRRFCLILCKILKRKHYFPSHAEAHLHRQQRFPEAPREGVPLRRQDRVFPQVAHRGGRLLLPGASAALRQVADDQHLQGDLRGAEGALRGPGDREDRLEVGEVPRDVLQSRLPCGLNLGGGFCRAFSGAGRERRKTGRRRI